MVFRNGKEILESIVEKTKEDKAFDEKLVLQQTKEDLLDLKEDVSYASVVLEELKKTGWVDQTKFQSIDTKLRSSEHKQEAINEIASVVNDIYERYDNLQVDQKEKVKTMTDALARSKLSLTGLKDEVLKSTEVDYQKIEQELTDEATKKLEKHWYSSWLAPSYKKHIHEKVEEFKLKADGKTPEKSALEKLTSSIRDRFFGLVGGYFIGKSVTDIVEDKIATYKDAALQKGNDAIDKVKTGVDKIATTDPKDVKEKSVELINQEELAAKRYIKKSVKKYFHKDLSEVQITRIAEKLSLKKQLKDGTSEWSKIIDATTHGEHDKLNDLNYLDATLETVVMPAEMFFHLVSVLNEEGIVDMKEVGLSVSGNVVQYGLKGFNLFGMGLATAVGTMDIKELNGHVSHLYDVSPLAAKHLLFALVYRTMDSPMVKMILNAGEYLGKAALWPVLEGKGDVDLMKNALVDIKNGNMNTAMKQMKETQSLMEKCGVNDPWLKKLIRATGDAVSEFDDYNKLVVKARNLGSGSGFMVSMKREFAGNKRLTTLLSTYADGDNRKEFLSWLGGEREKSTLQLSQTFQDSGSKRSVGIKNRGAKTFIGDNSVRHVLVDFAHHVEEQGKNTRLLLSNINLFGDISDKLYIKRIKGLGEVMHGSEIKDKAIWKFNTVEELSDFTENVKLLGRKAPSTLKFLIGKSPIFMVGGLAMSEGNTMDEKMNALAQGLRGLVPIVGPMMILREGAWAGDKTNLGQAGLGLALLGVDVLQIGRALYQRDMAKVLHMFTQPVVDMIEIGRFLRQTGKNTIKMVRDGSKLVREGKMVGLWEKIAESFKRMPKQKAAIAGAAIALIIYGAYEMMPEGMDKEAEVLFTKYKDNPAELDKVLADNWSTFDQDTKNECLKYALIARLGLSPETAGRLIVDRQNNTYVVSLPVMVEKQYGNAILASLQDNIAKVEPQAQIQMNVRGATAYEYRKQLAEKLKIDGEKPEDIPAVIDKQLEAMGYNPNIGKEKS